MDGFGGQKCGARYTPVARRVQPGSTGRLVRKEEPGTAAARRRRLLSPSAAGTSPGGSGSGAQETAVGSSVSGWAELSPGAIRKLHELGTAMSQEQCIALAIRCLLALTLFLRPSAWSEPFFYQRHDRQHLPTRKGQPFQQQKWTVRKDIRLFFMTPCRTAEVSKATGADPPQTCPLVKTDIFGLSSVRRSEASDARSASE